MYGASVEKSGTERLIDVLRVVLPKPVRRALVATKNGAVELAERSTRTYRVSAQRMTRYKHEHRGERCFIIGNGPSLRRTDLSLLRDEITFGLNRFYLAFDKLGFTTTYYVSVNELVMEQFAVDIAALPMPKFLYWPGQRYIPLANNTMFLRFGAPQTRFEGDIRRRLGPGSTVTYVAMQIAYFMGFSQVILIGVDHHFETQGRPHATVVTEGDDRDHFDPRYFGQDVKWQLPDLEGSEAAYRVAKERFNAAGREIIDATVGGHLRVFRKVNYEELF